MIFNIALEMIVRRAGIDTKGKIFTKSVQLLGFADDIDIITRNLATVKETYTRLKAEAMQMRLTMNTMKTKYMRARGRKVRTLLV